MFYFACASSVFVDRCQRFYTSLWLLIFDDSYGAIGWAECVTSISVRKKACQTHWLFRESWCRDKTWKQAAKREALDVMFAVV